MIHKPIEVTKKQYDILRINMAGWIFHRIDDEGRFWVKAATRESARMLKVYLSPDILSPEIL